MLIMPQENINEPVEVRVDFCGLRVLPRSMAWNGRVYDIRTMHSVHSINEGSTKRFFFSVSDNTNFFKLSFNTDTLEWRLIEMFAE
ncbi:MAG: hypothetical protein AAB886_00555 [Patescibacteria group bacterium]